MAAVEAHGRAMASRVRLVRVGGTDAVFAGAFDLLSGLERAWSRFVDGSDVDRLNRAPGQLLAVGPHTITLLEAMSEAWRLTGGRFDPTVLPELLRAGYDRSIHDPTRLSEIPSETAARPAHGLAGLRLDRSSGLAGLPRRTAIDPGGIGKGLAADLTVRAMLDAGADGALVEIGGDLAAAGHQSGADGWPVAVEDPRDPTRTLGTIVIRGGGVATSSTLTRRWGPPGAPRHHVFDPRAGRISATDLVAVTTVASCGWLAEAHATAILVAGTGELAGHCADHGIQAVAVDARGRVVASPALRILDPEGAR